VSPANMTAGISCCQGALRVAGSCSSTRLLRKAGSAVFRVPLPPYDTCTTFLQSTPAQIFHLHVDVLCACRWMVARWSGT